VVDPPMIVRFGVMVAIWDERKVRSLEQHEGWPLLWPELLGGPQQWGFRTLDSLSIAVKNFTRVKLKSVHQRNPARQFDQGFSRIGWIYFGFALFAEGQRR
jgi:hypothetical protein